MPQKGWISAQSGLPSTQLILSNWCYWPRPSSAVSVWSTSGPAPSVKATSFRPPWIPPKRKKPKKPLHCSWEHDTSVLGLHSSEELHSTLIAHSHWSWCIQWRGWLCYGYYRLANNPAIQQEILEVHEASKRGKQKKRNADESLIPVQGQGIQQVSTPSAQS